MCSSIALGIRAGENPASIEDWRNGNATGFDPVMNRLDTCILSHFRLLAAGYKSPARKVDVTARTQICGLAIADSINPWAYTL